MIVVSVGVRTGLRRPHIQVKTIPRPDALMITPVEKTGFPLAAVREDKIETFHRPVTRHVRTLMHQRQGIHQSADPAGLIVLITVFAQSDAIVAIGGIPVIAIVFLLEDIPSRREGQFVRHDRQPRHHIPVCEQALEQHGNAAASKLPDLEMKLQGISRHEIRATVFGWHLGSRHGIAGILTNSGGDKLKRGTGPIIAF